MSARDSLVSVVIPTQARPDLLERAVASAAGQTYSDLEVVVVDDASEVPIQTSWADPRVRVVRIELSKGTNNARNVGARAAVGRWVTFLDDDDELMPHMIATSLEAIEASPLPRPVTAITAMEIVDSSGAVIDVAQLPVSLPRGRHYFLDASLQNLRFAASNAFFAERELFLAIGGWDPEIRVWDHDDIYLRLNAVSSLQGIDRAGYRMHAHAGPRLSSDLLGSAIGLERTEAKHRKLFRQFPHQHAHFLGAVGVYYLRSGRWGAAVRTTTRGLMRDPGQARLWRWWAASLVGPRGLSVYRKLRRKRERVKGRGTASDSARKEPRGVPAEGTQPLPQGQVTDE
jgi:glycosyltransferase involved in cell wall biosynthesis